MKSRYRHAVLAVPLFLLLMAQRVAGGEGAGIIDRPVLEPELSAFTERISTCAVLVMKTDSGEIIYAHNRTALFESTYPAGSIMKPLSALVLLDNRELLGFDERKRVPCAGRYYPGGTLSFADADESIFNLPVDERKRKYFRCSLREGHGEVDLGRGLTSSCNAYFLTMASVNPRAFFGLLVNTFSLHENCGALLPGYMEISLPVDAAGATPFQLAASAIGEGHLLPLSPLKIAQIYAAIFSGGNIPIPFEKPFSPPPLKRRLQVSPGSLRIVNSALADVIKKGTLRGMDIKKNGLEIRAGKTGTATHRGGKYGTHGWNVISFRYRKADYLLLSFVEKGSGAKEARALSEKVLRSLPD
jgi:cell division protein FtsI/penicillin-binding protein 2